MGAFPIQKCDRAGHATEISPIFGTLPKGGITDLQIEVSKTMQKAWVGFAKEPHHTQGRDGTSFRS